MGSTLTMAFPRQPVVIVGNGFRPSCRVLGASEEEPLLLTDVRRPVDAARACKAEVRAKRRAHPVDEAVGAMRRETVFPPEAEDLDSPCSAIDPRLDAADEAVAEQDREHVPAPAPLGRREEEVPHVVEVEQGPEEAAVPDQWIERWEKRDGRGRLTRRYEQLDLRAQDEALAAHALDFDRDQLAVLDELLAQRGPSRMARTVRARLRGTEAAEDVSTAADAEEAVRAIPRKELVPKLCPQRDFVLEQVVR